MTIHTPEEAPAGVELPSHFAVRAWVDPVIDNLGHEIRIQMRKQLSATGFFPSQAIP